MIGTIVTVLSQVMIAASVSAPTGVYLMPDVWEGGCTVTYRVDSTANQFTAATKWATNQVTAVTGIGFTRVAGPADITIMGYPKATIPYEGWDLVGLWNQEQRSVWVTPVPSWTRRWLILHELMHGLGSAHSPVKEAVMNGQGYSVWEGFQQDDLDTLNWIAIANGCDPNE